MLGAVMFGHASFQPVIDAIIELAEKAAKEPRDFADARQLGDRRRTCSASSRPTCAPPTRSPAKQERHDAVARRQGQGRWRTSAREGQRAAIRQAARRRRVQGARGQDRALEHPRHRHPHRRPRPRRPSARSSPKSASCRAPTARRCSPAARPRRSWSPRSAPARTSSSSTRWQGTYKESFMLHYNFPPYSVGETGRMGAPGRREIGHGKLAWRAIRPMLPPQHEFPYTHPRRLRDHRVERLVLDGDGLRHLAGADGCRRAAEAAGRGHRHGPDPGRRALRRALRHPRRRGSSRRHGLQGRRHRRRHHLAADGHQDRRHHRGDHEGRARPGQGRPPAHPRRDGEGARPARAPSSASTRRASRPSRSRPTRSAK